MTPVESLQEWERTRYKRCKVCGGKELKSVYSLFDHHDIIIVRCLACGLHFQNPAPTEEYGREGYWGELTLLELNAAWEAQSALFHRRLRRIQQYEPRLKDLAGFRILEVGSGPGVFLRICQQMGAEVMGLEFGARKTIRDAYGIEIVERPIEDSWWQESYAEYFDLIASFDVLEHLYDPVTTIHRMKPLLRRDGILFLSTPCQDSMIERLGHLLYQSSGGRMRHLLNARYNQHHVQIFSSAELRRLLSEEGFHDVRSEVLKDYSYPTWSYVYRFLVPHEPAARIIGSLLAPGFHLLPLSNKAFVLGRA